MSFFLRHGHFCEKADSDATTYCWISIRLLGSETYLKAETQVLADPPGRLSFLAHVSHKAELP